MDTIQWVYLVCFFLGLGFAIISGLLSGVFGGHDVDAGHDHAGGHGADVHFSPWSPVVISMFIASFGGSGLILRQLHLPSYGHIPLAAVSGLVFAGLTFYVFWKIVSSTQGSSEVRLDDLVGSDAEVTTTIPANGMGEITYTAKQQRFNGPARAADNREIPARSVVRIVRIVSNTFYVERTA